jgi:hypothetical protein
MFQTKPFSFITITFKPPKLNNVPINVVVVIIICNQQPKQQVLKERELVKAKGVEDWQRGEHVHDSFIKTIRQL